MPVNHLPVNDVLRCLHCGREQAADEELFEEMVHRAHGVVDLAGDEMGPYAAIGRGEVLAKEFVDNDSHLSVGPGGPRCDGCSGPVQVAVQGAGRVTARCLRCGDSAEYRAKLPRQCQSLVAVLAPEHRVDRAMAKRITSAAAVAITCPNCTGPLEPQLDGRAVTCTFCETVCRIPEDTWALLKGPARQEPWYLLFDGPSVLRRDLEEEAAKIHRRREAEENRRRNMAQKAAQGAAAPAAPSAMIPQAVWWYTAAFSTASFPFGAAFVVYAALKDYYMDEPDLVAVAVWLVLSIVGFALIGNFKGKGKAADVPPSWCKLTIVLMVCGFLLSVVAFILLRTLKGGL